MIFRLISQSIQHLISSFIDKRSLSLTRIQSNVAIKFKEKSAGNVGTLSTREKTNETTLQDKAHIPSSTSINASNTTSKIYSEQLHRIVDEISKLSLVEIMDLNELLKKKEDNHVKTVQPTSQFVYKVRLIKYDETKKVPIIKRVKEVVETINLVQAKKLVESIPQVIRDNLSKTDAEAMKRKIEAVGGVCVIE